ncbi:MAG: VTT domain-containing protein [Thermoprotei archaeon]
MNEKFIMINLTSYLKNVKVGFIIVIVVILFVIFSFFKNFWPVNSQLFLDTRTFIINYGLIGVLLVTIIGGTVIPLGSPVLIMGAALIGMSLFPLILVASIGSTIGMIINYALAYYLGGAYVVKRVSVQKLNTAIRLWNKYGWVIYTIFGIIPFLPVELFSLICGLLKVRIDIFITLTFITRIIMNTILVLMVVHLGCRFVSC